MTLPADSYSARGAGGHYLLVLPALMAWQLPARMALFEVSLPWDGQQGTWVALHLLVAAAGVLVSLYLHRRRERLATA